MFCRKCGIGHLDTASTCPGCGDVLQPISPKQIDNHLALAIVVTVLFCLPLGIVGIVNAAQVNARAQAGDIAGAEESARKARRWSLWGLGIGIACYGLYAWVIIAGILSALPSP
jgi:hypothetical protein